MNYQKKLDLLIERALSKSGVSNKKFFIAEQDPTKTTKGGFEFTAEPEEPVNTNKTTKEPVKKKVVNKQTQPKPQTQTKSQTQPKPDETNISGGSDPAIWQPPTQNLTPLQKKEQADIKKFYNKADPEHNDAWTGVMVYGTLLGLGAFLLRKGYVRYKTITDPEYRTSTGLLAPVTDASRYGLAFWPGWIRWFGGQRLKDLEDLKKFLNIERERGNIPKSVYDDFIRGLSKSEQLIMRAKTFNAEIKAVKMGQQTMRQLIKKLPSAYRNNKTFVAGLLKYDEDVLAYNRPGGPRVRRGTAGGLKTTRASYASWYVNLTDDLKQVDWPSFQQEFGDKFGKLPAFVNPGEAWPFGNIELTRAEDQLETILRKATASGDPIPLSDYGINKLNLDGTKGRFLGSDGKMAGMGVTTKPTITIYGHDFAGSTIIRNLQTTSKNNVPCIEFHLKFLTGGKEDLKKFLISDEMTMIAGEKYSSAEANTIIRKLESDGTNIILPKKYTDPGATIPDMTQWIVDMKEIGLRQLYRNDAVRKRQVAYAEIYKILRKGL